jgi:hypothetical protein
MEDAAAVAAAAVAERDGNGMAVNEGNASGMAASMDDDGNEGTNNYIH